MATRKATADPRAKARKTPVKARRGPAKAPAPSARNITRSVKPSKAKRHYSGPEAWLLPRLEETYSKLEPKEQAEADAAGPASTRARRGTPPSAFRSSIHEGRDESVLAPALARSFWQDQFEAFQRRRTGERAAAVSRGPAMPALT